MDQSILHEGKNLLETSLAFHPEQYHAMANMLACRTIEKGGRILHCPDCGNETVVYNPCNQRGCPVCSKKNQIQWANKLKKKLLPIGHYHLIFSLPEEMVFAWKFNADLLISSFFHSVRLAFKKIQKDMGITLGIVMVFQSHGKGICYKPHMHCIVTNHGINTNNKWVSCGSLSYTSLRDSIKEKLIPYFSKKLPAQHRHLFTKMFRDCEERQWSVYPAIHKFNGESIVNYLSKSVSGSVLDINKNVDFDKDKKTYTIHEHHQGEETATTLDEHTFWDRYLSHIPPKGAVTIRNYGLYSNKYSDVLEQIRIKEFPAESTTEDIINEEEECSSCHGTMEMKETFTPSDLPLIMRLHIQKNNGPPEHGFSFQSAKSLLC